MWGSLRGDRPRMQKGRKILFEIFCGDASLSSSWIRACAPLDIRTGWDVEKDRESSQRRFWRRRDPFCFFADECLWEQGCTPRILAGFARRATEARIEW